MYFLNIKSYTTLMPTASQCLRKTHFMLPKGEKVRSFAIYILPSYFFYSFSCLYFLEMWFVLLPRQQIFLLRSFFYFWLLNSCSYKTMPPYQTHSIFYKISQIKWINYSTNTKLFLYILTSETWFVWTPTSIIIVDK